MFIQDSYDALDDALNRLSAPHIYFPQDNLLQKSILAAHITKLSNELLLISSSFAFHSPSILAGLDEEKIQYIAKNAPAGYKKELMDSMRQSFTVKEIFEICKEMDRQSGEQTTPNQDRIKNVIQYIKDNRAAFEF